MRHATHHRARSRASAERAALRSGRLSERERLGAELYTQTSSRAALGAAKLRKAAACGARPLLRCVIPLSCAAAFCSAVGACHFWTSEPTQTSDNCDTCQQRGDRECAEKRARGAPTAISSVHGRHKPSNVIQRQARAIVGHHLPDGLLAVRVAPRRCRVLSPRRPRDRLRLGQRRKEEHRCVHRLREHLLHLLLRALFAMPPYPVALLPQPPVSAAVSNPAFVTQHSASALGTRLDRCQARK